MDERDADILERPLRALQTWSKRWPAWADGAAQRVQGFDPDELSTGQVIGIAVGTAATIGGVLVAVGPGEGAMPQAAQATRTRVAARRAGGNRRRDKRALTEVDGMTLGERATLTFAPLAEGLSETAGLAAVQVAQGRTAMQGQLADLTERGQKMTRRTRKELGKQSDELQKQLRLLQKELAKQSKRAGRKLPNTDTVRDAAASAGDNVGKRFAAVGAATAAAATPLLERARHTDFADQVRGFADTTRERGADLTERVREEFLPLVVERAGRVRDAVGDQGAELVNRAREEFGPQVSEAASRLGSRLMEFGENSASELAGAKQAAVAALVPPSQRKQSSWVGKSIWAILLASLIGLVVYYLRDEERRQQFMNTAQSVAEQGREIIRDFQGYDEEF